MMMPPLPEANHEGGKGKKRLPFFKKKSKSPTRVDGDVDGRGHCNGEDNISGSHHRRPRGLARENSAAHRPAVERDPRAEAERRRSEQALDGDERSLSGSGRRNRKSISLGQRAEDLCRRAALLDQQNGAGNVGALALDPRREPRAGHLPLGRVAEDEVGLDRLPPGSAPRSHKGRRKKHSSARKKNDSPFSDYQMDDRRSFTRRSSTGDISSDEEDVNVEASGHTAASEPSHHSAQRGHATNHSVHTQLTQNSDEKSTWDEEPMTKPSAPAGRRNPHRASAFDVDETRASLMSSLQDADSFRKRTSRQSQETDFKSSLTDCLGDMGFDPDAVRVAIKSTNATSSKDAPRVIEWLGEHEGECQSRSAGSRSSQNRRATIDSGDGSRDVRYKSNHTFNERSISTDSGDDTHYTHATKKSHASHVSNATTDTMESDENVQELKTSLRNLGYSRDDIRRHKEVYRRHSHEMRAEQFIMAMMEIEDEESPPPKPSPPKPSPPRKKTPPEQRPDLVESISEMGFERQQVARVIARMHKSGATVSADGVLAELLSGGGRHERMSEPSNISQSAHERHSPGSERPAEKSRRNRSTLGRSDNSTRAMQIVKEEEEENLTIEIAPGQHARLLKGRQTWNAMHDGTAVASPCSICNATLQCTPDADYVLCPDCNVVSPLGRGEVRRGASERNVGREGRGLSRNASVGKNVGAVGLGYKPT
ncbi:hypothetical protein ACHAXT_001417 [Thalassiosira profunda]